MYQVQDSVALVRAHKRFVSARRAGRRFVPRTVVLLGLTSLFTDISSEMVSAILPLYLITVRGLDPMQFGLVNGIYQGGSSLVRIAFGFLADRLHRYRDVAAAGYGLSAVCKLGLLLVSSWGAIAGLIFADRTGKGIRTAPRDAMISLSSRRDELGTSFGVHRAMDTCGAMLGPLLAFGLLALNPTGFDGIFLVSFCVALIGVAILVLLVDEPEVTPEQAAEQPEQPPVTIRGATTLLRAPGFAPLVVVAAVLGLVTIGDAFIYLQLERTLDFDPSLFPLLFVGTATIFMVMAVPAGRLADRVGHARVFATGYAILLAVYLLLLSGSDGMFLLPVTLVGLGLFYASTDGVLAAMASACAPASLRGTGLAVLGTATGLAQFGASIAFGTLWAVFGVHDAFLCFTAGLAVALVVAAAVLLRRTAPAAA
jgi:MFS family permease